MERDHSAELIRILADINTVLNSIKKELHAITTSAKAGENKKED